MNVHLFKKNLNKVKIVSLHSLFRCGLQYFRMRIDCVNWCGESGCREH